MLRSTRHDTEYPDWVFALVFQSKDPGTSHKLRSFWAGPYHVTKLIALALAEIKLVNYP